MASGIAPPHFLKPRNQLLLAATVCWYIAVATRNPLVCGLAVWATVALAMSWFAARGLISNVHVQRSHSGRAFQGNSLGVTLRVQGLDQKAPEMVLVEDTFSPGGTWKFQKLLEDRLYQGVMEEVAYAGSCDHRRGMYVLGPVRLEAYDPFGFFRRELILDHFTELVVYPLAVELRQAQVLGEGTLAHVGLEIAHRTGASEEFLGVREYRPGDSPRIIHWRSSAHHDRLMVKEFEEERTTLVSFFLDLGRLGLVGVGDQTSVEYGIKACASLAKRTVDLGHRLQLFGIGEKVEFVGPGGGTTHLLTVLDRLAFFRAQGDSGFAAVVGDLVPELPTGSTAIMIMGATTIDLPHLSNVIARLRDRGILTILVLVDDRAFIKIFQDQERRHIAALPLPQMVKELRLLGARVHVIARAKSMEQALLNGLEQEAAS